jgi:hypothetical protein
MFLASKGAINLLRTSENPVQRHRQWQNPFEIQFSIFHLMYPHIFHPIISPAVMHCNYLLISTHCHCVHSHEKLDFCSIFGPVMFPPQLEMIARQFVVWKEQLKREKHIEMLGY